MFFICREKVQKAQKTQDGTACLWPGHARRESKKGESEEFRGGCECPEADHSTAQLPIKGLKKYFRLDRICPTPSHRISLANDEEAFAIEIWRAAKSGLFPRTGIGTLCPWNETEKL
jgi:hypothetical protein